MFTRVVEITSKSGKTHEIANTTAGRLAALSAHILEEAHGDCDGRGAARPREVRDPRTDAARPLRNRQPKRFRSGTGPLGPAPA